MDTTILNSGWMVVSDLHARGCARYRQKNVQERRDGKSLEGEWEGEKTVEDVDEHRAMRAAYNAARRRVASVGYETLAGTYVPYERGAALEEAIREAYEIVREHNEAAACTGIEGGFMAFALTGENEAAAAAVLQRAQDTLGQLQQAIRSADPKSIRAALRDARGMDAVFSGSRGQALSDAFQDARRIAREIVRASKSGDDSLDALCSAANDVRTARMLFAELGDAGRSGQDHGLPICLPRIADIPEPVEETST